MYPNRVEKLSLLFRPIMRMNTHFSHSSLRMNSLLFALVRRRCAIISAIIIFCLLPVFGGCDFPTANQAASAQQDFQTTQFRYINMTNLPNGHFIQASFATYSQAQRARIDVGTTSTLVAQFTASSFLLSQADSGRVRLIDDAGQALYTLPPYLFTNRNARYTFVGLPTGSGTKLGIDTVIVLTSLPSDTVGNVINIRIVNCINEPRKTYSFNIGCPSGTPLGGALAFRRSSGVVPVSIAQGGVLSLALTEQSTTASGIVSVQQGLFTLQPLRQGNSYTLLLYKDVNANIQLLGINERSPERLMVQSTTAPLTYLRVANFAANAIANVRYGQNEILRNIAAGTVSSYQSATACAAVGRDTLTISRLQGTLLSQQLTTSLEVNGSQTLFLSDSLALAVPTNTRVPGGDSAVVRVINFSPETISVVRGTTTRQPERQIAANLVRGGISAPLTIQRGGMSLHPFIVFNADSAQQSGITSLPETSSKSYILVIERGKMTVVPDIGQGAMQPSSMLTPISAGSVVQVINAFGEMVKTGVRLGTMFQDTLGYGASILTVIPSGGMETVGMDDAAPVNFMPRVGQHTIVIGSGVGTNRRITVERSLWTPAQRELRPSSVQSAVRYYNATSNINALRVLSDGDGEFALLNNLLPSYQFSATQRFFRSQTRTLTFQNLTVPRDTSTVFTARNLNFLRGKAYTIILSGRAAARDTLYNALVLQEY